MEYKKIPNILPAQEALCDRVSQGIESAQELAQQEADRQREQQKAVALERVQSGLQALISIGEDVSDSAREEFGLTDQDAENARAFAQSNQAEAEQHSDQEQRQISEIFELLSNRALAEEGQHTVTILSPNSPPSNFPFMYETDPEDDYDVLSTIRLTKQGEVYVLEYEIGDSRDEYTKTDTRTVLFADGLKKPLTTHAPLSSLCSDNGEIALTGLRLGQWDWPLNVLKNFCAKLEADELVKESSSLLADQPWNQRNHPWKEYRALAVEVLNGATWTLIQTRPYCSDRSNPEEEPEQVLIQHAIQDKQVASEALHTPDGSFTDKDVFVWHFRALQSTIDGSPPGPTSV